MTTEFRTQAPRIKVYTRSLNPFLYETAMSFVSLPYPKVRLLGQGALEYLESVISDESCDIAVNIDEDAFVTNPQVLQDLIQYVLNNDITLAGMPDGGVIPIRHNNPLVVNPYFSIMDTARIRQLLAEESYEGFPLDGPGYLDDFPRELLRGDFSMKPFEPYEELLVWLARRSKVLYLDARVHEDGLSTVLLDHQSRPFLIHTWFSRMYPKSPEHRRRIHARINESAAHNPAGRRVSISQAAIVRARVEIEVVRRQSVQVLRRSALARRVVAGIRSRRLP